MRIETEIENEDRRVAPLAASVSSVHFALLSLIRRTGEPVDVSVQHSPLRAHGSQAKPVRAVQCRTAAERREVAASRLAGPVLGRSRPLDVGVHGASLRSLGRVSRSDTDLATPLRRAAQPLGAGDLRVLAGDAGPRSFSGSLSPAWRDQVLGTYYAAWPFVEYGEFLCLSYAVREALWTR